MATSITIRTERISVLTAAGVDGVLAVAGRLIAPLLQSGTAGVYQPQQ